MHMLGDVVHALVHPQRLLDALLRCESRGQGRELRPQIFLHAPALKHGGMKQGAKETPCDCLHSFSRDAFDVMAFLQQRSMQIQRKVL